MADTSTISGLQAELWSAKFFKYGLQNMFFGKFIGKSMSVSELPKNQRTDIVRTDPNAMIQVIMDLTKKKGDQITFPLIYPLSENGRVNGTLESNEEGILNYEFVQAIKDWGHATKDAGALTRQQAAFEWDPVAREQLALWYARALDAATYNVMAGLKFTGEDAVDLFAARANTRKLVCGLDAASSIFETTTVDASLGLDWYFSLDVVSYARRKAVASEPIIRPLKIDGGEYWLMFIHPLQAKALKDSSDWQTLQKSFISVRGNKNPMFSGMLGIFDQVILYEYQRTQTRLGDGTGEDLDANTFDTGDVVTSGATCARAIFAGTQAAVHAYAQKPAFHRKDFDYGYKHGYAVRMLMGVGRPYFNSVDFGVMVVDTAVLPD